MLTGSFTSGPARRSARAAGGNCALRAGPPPAALVAEAVPRLLPGPPLELRWTMRVFFGASR